MNRRPVVVKLQGHADNIVALLLEQRRHNRGIDPAGHCDDNPSLRRGFVETETNGISDPSRRRDFAHGRCQTLTQLPRNKLFTAYRSEPVEMFLGKCCIQTIIASNLIAHGHYLFSGLILF
jgi:hypothetical protein